MKCLTTALVIIMLLFASQNTFAEGTWTTFPEKYTYWNRLAVLSNGDVWISGVDVWRYDGETWTSLTEEGGFSDNNVFSIAASAKGEVWFGTMNGVTRYDGETWTTFNKGEDGLPDGEGPFTAIAITPSGKVWISKPPSGVSMYDGETWTSFTTDDGLADNRIMSLAVGPDNTVWIGNYGGLTHYIPDTETFVVETDILPEEIEIISNYPNPFNPETTIEFTLAKAGFVNLAVHNQAGQKVRELISENLTSGVHTVVWNGRDDTGMPVSSGVYITRIVMGEKVAAKSMMLVK